MLNRAGGPAQGGTAALRTLGPARMHEGDDPDRAAPLVAFTVDASRQLPASSWISKSIPVTPAASPTVTSVLAGVATKPLSAATLTA